MIKIENKIIYEVLRIIDGKSIFLEDHIERMESSFKLINEKNPFNETEIKNKIEKLINCENKLFGNIKITVELNKKELKVFFVEHFYPSNEMYENGVNTILYFGERKNPNAKIIDDNFRSKVNKEIKEKNAFEAILVDSNGYITEGSKSNIFMLKGNCLLTSPLKSVLPGVTRKKIIKVAKDLNINVEEIEYKYDEICDLDGMFISGTSPKVLPIQSVNNIKFDVNNNIIKKIITKYDEEINNYLKKY